jgi:hypothetical protein
MTGDDSFMGILCKLFGHKWDHCYCSRCHEYRDEAHDWNGCTCRKCWKRRDEAHDWNGCKCRICYKERDEAHVWDGCRCKICYKKRDEGHDWTPCICKKCYKKQENPQHHWDFTFHGVISPAGSLPVKCKNCGTTADLPPAGRYFCPVCFTAGDWESVPSDDPMFLEYVFKCAKCGYRDGYERNDSY